MAISQKEISAPPATLLQRKIGTLTRLGPKGRIILIEPDQNIGV
jgi:hypothetical protein